MDRWTTTYRRTCDSVYCTYVVCHDYNGTTAMLHQRMCSSFIKEQQQADCTGWWMVWVGHVCIHTCIVGHHRPIAAVIYVGHIGWSEGVGCGAAAHSSGYIDSSGCRPHWHIDHHPIHPSTGRIPIGACIINRMVNKNQCYNNSGPTQVHWKSSPNSQM